MLVAGDIMCDHYVWGDVERISPEAPVQVLRWEREDRRAGGAANAAMNLAALGCRVHLVGIVGRDDAGTWLLRTLQAAGIDTAGVAVSSTRPTTMKSRLIARGQHMLRIDREQTGTIGQTEERRLVAAVRNLARVSSVVCSDYAKGALSRPVLAACFSLPGRPFVTVDPKGRDFTKYAGASLLTPNEKELMEAVDDSDPHMSDDAVVGRRAEALMRQLGLRALVVTRGARGMDVFDASARSIRRTHVPAFRRHEVFDVTGAGDTVAAVLAMSVAAGLPLLDAARVANIAAGIVVGKVGTAVADLDALSRALNEKAPPRRRRKA
jgi:D-beta-D-heptose 7-phosphate kinase/D-beta-D-heptose 1-phosphate adenosyltransferase